MATKIPQGFMAPLSISDFRDVAGHPTTIDGAPVWSVSDPTKAEIIDVGGVPHVAPLLTGDPIGDAQQVIATCDVDLGGAIKEVAFMGEFDVPAGEAATATVALGSVVPRP